MPNVVFSYVFSMLNLGRILISNLVVTYLFMHSLPDMILLYLATSLSVLLYFTLKDVLTEDTPLKFYTFID